MANGRKKMHIFRGDADFFILIILLVEFINIFIKRLTIALYFDKLDVEPLESGFKSIIDCTYVGETG